jgi:hypothetical protein
VDKAKRKSIKMNNEKQPAEPALVDKIEAIRVLKEIVRGGFGKEVHELAEKKLIKLLSEI